ncbi:hypothetical protein GCM10009122_14150 [Fulvivirga kasyanovii]|uniref:Uncharacterized protein n=1 Tax=Fulvivirga kasyanovii TaxID=396812 RepID=A0ABW9RNJ3_9BACT|nr:hypothetical protein [Fulvivirga kasyanovii]MTI25561.1 hypothetical protein [Fulvivirga kasyanovii]
MQSINIKKVRQANQLLQGENTGRSKEFARKLNMSESSLFYLIKLLKEELHAPIVYDRTLQSYKYDVKGSIVIGFFKQ